MRRLIVFCFISALFFSCSVSAKGEFNIMDFGAKNDSTVLSTVAVQSAIDKCSKKGGKVIVPEGNYQIGTIFLKSNVELHLMKGARLLGSTNLDDYSTEVKTAIEAPALNRCLFYAENAKNIKLTGEGVIDGRGYQTNFPIGKAGAYNQRPMMFRMINVEGLEFIDISLKHAASWCLHLIECSDIVARRVNIDSHVNRNNDGFDLDGCQRVLIEDCVIRSGDDAICPKGTTARLCEDIVVRNCRVTSNTSAFKLGTSSLGGFRNIKVSNCDFTDSRMGAIKIQMVDEGIMENVEISDIVMNNVEGPIFIRLGGRGRMYDKPIQQVQAKTAQNEGGKVGSMKNITIRNIKATVASDISKRCGIMITGIPGAYIENITLENIEVVYPGGVKKGEFQTTVDEDIARYPEQFFFGVLPSWGAYVRHAKNVTFNNVKFYTIAPDEREEVVLDDVINFVRK